MFTLAVVHCLTHSTFRSPNFVHRFIPPSLIYPIFFSRRIYDLQKKDVSFDSPIAMLGTLSPTFLKMLKSTFESWLERHLELSNRFCKEVVYGLVSNCYCSDLTLHAFAGKWTSIKGL